MPINGNGNDNLLLGTGGADEINGNGGADILFGFAGNDSLNGGQGDDILFGGQGQDQLRGGQGDDYLDGGTGADVINGGQGDDVLAGGGGSDSFVFGQNFGGDLIVDFGSGDTIDLTAFNSITNVSQLTIVQAGPNVVVYVPGGSGGSIVVQNATIAQVTSSIQVACLLRGTMVRTPAGDVAVESLAIGDEVITVDGKAKPVKWIGRRAYARAFIENNARVAPVVLKAGSLGRNLPARDLSVSPEHAVLVDNVLVAAKSLVNGTTILQDFGAESVEYFHLEFDAPEVIFTNGVATESYVDHGNRRMFANYAEYVELYGETPASTGARRFDFVAEGEALEAIRARLGGALTRVA